MTLTDKDYEEFSNDIARLGTQVLVEKSRRLRAIEQLKMMVHGHFQESIDGPIRCQCALCELAEKFLAEAEEWA